MWTTALIVAVICGVAGVACATSATLTVTPSPNVKPGDVLTFAAQVAYLDPAPVVSVILGGTMWSTELQTVKYPGPGQAATVKFAKNYTVPGNAKSGASLCFMVVSGGGNVEMKQPISTKNCVTVKVIAQIQKNPKNVELSKMQFLSDLVVSDVHIDQSNAKIIWAKVVNNGAGIAQASTLCVQVRQWSGGGSKQLANKQVPVKTLKSGEEVSIAVDTGVMGPVFYELTVDCKYMVNELNENNNKATLDQTIK